MLSGCITRSHARLHVATYVRINARTQVRLDARTRVTSYAGIVYRCLYPFVSLITPWCGDHSKYRVLLLHKAKLGTCQVGLSWFCHHVCNGPDSQTNPFTAPMKASKNPAQHWPSLNPAIGLMMSQIDCASKYQSRWRRTYIYIYIYTG